MEESRLDLDPSLNPFFFFKFLERNILGKKMFDFLLGFGK